MRIMREAVLVAVVSSMAAAANTPPIVNAGPDTTIRLGYKLSFYGTVTDDSLPNPEPIIEWKQISGPVNGAIILAPDAAGSEVEFTATGVYTFRLSANDGAIVATDDVAITVLDSIPFLVLSPVAGERIEIGSSYTVSWQLDPPGTSVNIELSTNNGRTFAKLNVDGRTSAASWTWNIDPTVPVSDQCIIQVVKYFDKNQKAQSGVFSLLDTNQSNSKAPPRISHGAPTARPGNAGRGAFSVNGSRLEQHESGSSQGVLIRGLADEDEPARRAVRIR